MADKSIVLTHIAPEPVGPYSQAIRSGDLVFISGQIPIDPKSGQLIGRNVAEQTAVVLTHIKNILDAIEGALGNVVKTTVFLTDLAAFEEMNSVYERAFNFEPPARSCVQVAALPKGASVEIEAIAVVKRRADHGPLGGMLGGAQGGPTHG
jgi:2-iminobutanoate/2-iminopropanoate deaminase